MGYRRILASFGGLLVTIGCRLQSGYQAWIRSDEGPYAAGLRSDNLVIENNSGPCR
jgi:hypothetical protein